MLSGRFSSSATYQFYDNLTHLDVLVTYIQQKFCADDQKCHAQARSLTSADYFDFDYDAISQTVVLSGFWRTASLETAYGDDNFDIQSRSARTEIGVLTNEKPNSPEEVSLGGYLIVLEKDSKPSTLYLCVIFVVMLTV